MPILEQANGFEFVQSEANGALSRDEVTLISGQNLRSGAVLGRITASGKYTQYAPAASDGSQLFAGILGYTTDATGGDQKVSIFARLGEVKKDRLIKPTLTTPQAATLATQMASAFVVER